MRNAFSHLHRKQIPFPVSLHQQRRPLTGLLHPSSPWSVVEPRWGLEPGEQGGGGGGDDSCYLSKTSCELSIRVMLSLKRTHRYGDNHWNRHVLGVHVHRHWNVDRHRHGKHYHLHLLHICGGQENREWMDFQRETDLSQRISMALSNIPFTEWVMNTH